MNRTVQYQAKTFVPAPRASTGLAVGFSDVVLKRPFFEHTHILSLPVQQVPTPDTPQGWTALFDLGKQPLSAKNIPFAPDLLNFQVPTEETPQGWTALFDLGKQPSSAKNIQFAPDLLTRQIPTADTPQGWWQPLAEALIKPFNAALQQHYFFQTPGFVFIPPPEGWTALFDRGRQPSTAANMMFAPMFIQFQVPTAATPQGWWQPMSVTIVKPVNTALQQFDAQRSNVEPPPPPAQDEMHFRYFFSDVGMMTSR